LKSEESEVLQNNNDDLDNEEAGQRILPSIQNNLKKQLASQVRNKYLAEEVQKIRESC